LEAAAFALGFVQGQRVLPVRNEEPSSPFRILVLGDGNFSYSQALSQML
jgi:hypothetical protein